MKKLAAIAAAVVLVTTASAEIRLPEIISDHMVLRQSSDVKIWGWATPDAQIAVTPDWTTVPATTTCDPDGRWLITLATPTASMTPHSLTIEETIVKNKRNNYNNSLSLNDILIGEVWFCSGQSNMEMPMEGFWDCPVEGSAEAIALSGQQKGVRMVTIPKSGALEPMETVSGSWKVSCPENTRWFSATAYNFAKMLHAVLEIPVGIISCSWGGSKVEGWMPESIVSQYPDIDCENVKEPEEGNKGWNWHYYTPFIMYNGMLHPVINYTISGFLWYQGESNVGKHDTYPERLSTMVSTWRELWDLGELPFYFVELVPYVYGGDGTSGARFREMQLAVSRTIPNAGLVCTNDLAYPYEKNQIHPCQKEKVGQRLAYMALNRTYGLDAIDCQGPIFKEMKIDGDKANIYFENSHNGFSPWYDLIGFEIAGADKVFHEAKAEISPGNKYVIVSSPEVPEPVAVRYCFKDFQVGNLTGSRNLPAFPFRTDNW